VIIIGFPPCNLFLCNLLRINVSQVSFLPTNQMFSFSLTCFIIFHTCPGEIYYTFPYEILGGGWRKMQGRGGNVSCGIVSTRFNRIGGKL
jgi:hypothetical protein